jgi:DNA-binding HxlR family transcriptional regulator
VTPQASSTGRGLQALGDRWSLLILRDAFLNHHRRFGQWRDALGVSESVLAGRLKDLVEQGVLEQRAYETAPPRFEYRLTPQGLEVWRILVAIWAWERTWVTGKAKLLPALVHEACGSETEPVLACGACRAPTAARDVSTRIGPSGRLDLAAPPRSRRRSSKEQEPTDPQLLFPETFAIVGDRWSAVVVAAVFIGLRRFSDIERAIGISPPLLSERLKRLVGIGVLEREGARYRLSEKGLAFFDVAILFYDWAERWYGNPERPALRVTHEACGALFHPVLECTRCGEVLERDAVRFTPGPAR